MDTASTQTPLTQEAAIETAPRRRFGFVRQFLHSSSGVIGASLILLLLVCAFFAPWVAPYRPDSMQYSATLQGPGIHHLFGTDKFGRDVLSRVIWGARVTLEMSVVSVALALVLGTLIGVASALYRSWVDVLLSRVMEVIFAFPAVLLAIAIMAAFGPTMVTAMVAIGIIFTPIIARIARASAIQVAALDYIQAAHAVGAKNGRIIIRHIIPNILPTLTVQTSLSLGFAILVQAALAFLGLGIQPPTPAWGLLLSEGRAVMQQAPWVVAFPGIAIVASVFGFNLLGDGLSDLLDPHQKVRKSG